MNGRTSTTHPQVAAYLDELTRILADLDPAERAEVVEGVREHVEAALTGTKVTDADVRAALGELGPAQAVADEAYAGRPPVARTVNRPPLTSRGWVPALVAGFEAVALFVVLAVAGSSGGVSESTVSSSTAAGSTSTVVAETHFNGSVGAGVTAFLAAVPFWLVVLVLVGMSALWTGREKALLTALVPVCAVAFALLPQAGYALVGINGVYVGAWLALAVAVVGGGALVLALVRRAYHRADALAA